jgi:transposase
MALKNPKKQHHGTFNPYPSGVFTRYESKVIGSIFLLKPLLALLGLEDIVDSVCPLASNRASVSVGEVCKILVLNRLNSPRPLYKVEDWADHVSIIDLFGIPPHLLNDDKLGRCLELLAAYSGDIEALLCLKLIRNFGVSPDLVIWDSTSFYFEGAYDDSEFVTFGYAVEGRTDAKRVRIGMCMDAGTGIPLTSSRESGRRPDSELVVDNLETLKATLSKAGRADYVVVADRALASVKNVFLLDSRGTKFVAPADDDDCYTRLILGTSDDEFREADYRSKDGEPFFIAERGICLHRKLDGEERQYESGWFRAIVIKSPSKLKVDEMKRSKETETVDAWLRDVRDNKINRRHYKKPEYVEKRIDAFFSGPLRRYRKIYNPKVVSNGNHLDFSWSVDEEALQRLIALDGKYVVISNQMDPAVSAADIFRTSRRRSHIETRMRYLKSQLKVRPVFLESEMRIRGLAFVTNLALVVYCLLEHLLKQADIDESVRELFLDFDQIALTKAKLPNGAEVSHVENALPFHYRTLDKLGLLIEEYRRPQG